MALAAVGVVQAIEARRPVYHRHKLQNSGWAQCWQVRMIIVDADKGYFREAIKQEIEQC